MPHRPADSRLLANLLSHERDYVRSLHSQLDYSQASLASFSAYAAASPPPASHAIGSVATALLGAQDALRGYVFAVEEWCEQLKMLKDMEDEVGMIARDREILVDRLIKASKTNNSKRRSLLPSSTSNNHSSSSFSASGQVLEQPSFSNSKLNLAQNELQACETHLTEKERILAQMRESCLAGGLRMRCRALVECGWKWSEVGKTGLQDLDSATSRGSFERPGFLTQKPLPDINFPYQRPSSDLSSSLAPSQSASQISHPGAISEQYHPNASGSSGPTHASAPEADIHDEPRFALDIPPAHAISEEDHYTPPQARVSERAPNEDEVGGSSVEEEEDGRQYEVHENLLFSHPLASKGTSNQLGSKTRLQLKRPKRLNSDSSTIMPSSTSAPAGGASAQNNDRFGTSSSGRTSDGNPDSPRTRKRSTFLGLGALSGIFHRRDRSASEPVEVSDPMSSSPKKQKWRTRTDKYLKKAGKDGDSSDDEARPAPAQTNSFPSYLLPSTEPMTQSESRSRPTEKESGASRPKRAPSAGRKLRKLSDADAQRKTSVAEDNKSTQQPSTAKGSGATKKNSGAPRSQTIGNGLTLSPLSSASVSRSSTVRSQSTIKSSSTMRSASLDLPSSSAKAGQTGTVSDSGRKASGTARRHRKSLGHVSMPPTHGQTSLLSIVEDVTKQNRQGWQHSNPNSLLFEIKAPKSVYHTLDLETPMYTPSQQKGTSDVAGARRESPLRHQLVNNYRRNSILASSSEPSLPLKSLPAIPSPALKAPLRSALRNRSASPGSATMTPPRTSSPAPIRGRAALNGGPPTAIRPPTERKDSAASSVKDDDTASLSSAYETGHEDFDSGSTTPDGLMQQTLPNGHVSEIKSNGSHASGSSTAGTATPPSRRKSVRMSLKPTFSPTPPAITDYEEDHTPWAPGKTSGKEGPESNGWVSRKTEKTIWEDSSDEDEEYSRAKQMLSKASRKLDKAYKGGV